MPHGARRLGVSELVECPDGSDPMRCADVRDEARGVQRRQPGHLDRVLQSQRAEQRRDPMRFRVKKPEARERAAHVLHVGRGMDRHVPFNERRGHASEGQAAV